jgi:preprotein translocase subunit YajC
LELEQALTALMTQAEGGQGGAPPVQSPIPGCEQTGGMFVPIILMFVIIYFVLLRPQQKQQKKHQAMLKALKKGDRVITNSGIFGTLAGLTESTATLEVAKNVHIKLLRGQIAGLQPTEKEADSQPVVPDVPK